MNVWKNCSRCGGDGKILDPRIWGDLQPEITCPFCKGKGGKYVEVEETGDTRNIPPLKEKEGDSILDY